jgi:hypothetical protein
MPRASKNARVIPSLNDGRLSPGLCYDPVTIRVPDCSPREPAIMVRTDSSDAVNILEAT